MTLSEIMAQNIATTKYEALPQEVIEVTKKCILDTLGVSIAATGLLPSVSRVVKVAKEASGKPQSTILVFGNKVSPWTAALANGAMAHALDYDDLHSEAFVHPSGVTVTAGFATAEHKGKISGKQLITAVALGNDLSCRMGCAITWKLDWMLSMVFGTFSAAAVAGKLLGLDSEGIADALGIAYCQAAGHMELAFDPGKDLRALYTAFPTHTGVLSAFLAREGIAGTRTCLDGRAGLFSLYFGNEYQQEVLTYNLGKSFEGINVGFKPWPACGFAHNSIEATLQLVSEHDIKPQIIKEIVVYVSEAEQNLCEPLETRRRPQTMMDARYSTPYIIAAAVLRRRVGLTEFTIDSLKNPEILDLAKKVTYKVEPAFNVKRAAKPSRVEIRTGDGKVYSKQSDFPHGYLQNPMDMKEIIEKFRECASFAVKPLPKQNVEKVIEMLANLEEVDDVSSVVPLLVAST